MEFLTLKAGKPRPTSVVRGGITYEKDIYPPLLELIKESNGEMLFVDSDDERFSKKELERMMQEILLIHDSLSFFLSLSFEQTGYPPPVDKVSGMAPCRS